MKDTLNNADNSYGNLEQAHKELNINFNNLEDKLKETKYKNEQDMRAAK